jgi:hypothetical protein
MEAIKVGAKGQAGSVSDILRLTPKINHSTSYLVSTNSLQRPFRLNAKHSSYFIEPLQKVYRYYINVAKEY